MISAAEITQKSVSKKPAAQEEIIFFLMKSCIDKSNGGVQN